MMIRRVIVENDLRQKRKLDSICWFFSIDRANETCTLSNMQKYKARVRRRIHFCSVIATRRIKVRCFWFYATAEHKWCQYKVWARRQIIQNYSKYRLNYSACSICLNRRTATSSAVILANQWGTVCFIKFSGVAQLTNGLLVFDQLSFLFFTYRKFMELEILFR